MKPPVRRRPPISLTLSPEGTSTLTRIAAREGTSRSRVVERLVADMLRPTWEPPARPQGYSWICLVDGKLAVGSFDSETLARRWADDTLPRGTRTDFYAVTIPEEYEHA